MTPASLILFAAVYFAAASAAVISATLAAYALAANRARALLRSARAMRFARRAAGGAMAGVAVAIATR